MGVELEVVDFFVDAACGEELGVGAALGDAALVEDEDEVCVADGAEPLGNDEGGAALDEDFEGLLDEHFGLGVHAGGGVVEDEDPGVHEEGPGDGDALLLAAGEGDAPFADPGVVALGEGFDEFADAGGFGGAFDVFEGASGVA